MTTVSVNGSHIIQMKNLVNISNNFITHTLDKFVAWKDEICKGGQLCNDVLTLGSFIFMIWFMYVAMEPILVFR